jgi:hypothetical protein
MNKLGERIALVLVTRNQVLPVRTSLALVFTRGLWQDVVIVANDSLVPRERNIGSALFLSGEADRMLMLDDDIGCTADDLDRLLNQDCDIIGGAYVARNAAQRHWIFIESSGEPGVITEERVKADTPFEVARVGTGFLSIRRKVFQTLKHDPLIRTYTCEGREIFDFWQVGVFPCPFPQLPPMEHVSEDWFFCDRARAAGFKVYVDPRVQLLHWGVTCFAGPVEAAAAPSASEG